MTVSYSIVNNGTEDVVNKEIELSIGVDYIESNNHDIDAGDTVSDTFTYDLDDAGLLNQLITVTVGNGTDSDSATFICETDDTVTYESTYYVSKHDRVSITVFDDAGDPVDDLSEDIGSWNVTDLASNASDGTVTGVTQIKDNNYWIYVENVSSMSYDVGTATIWYDGDIIAE